MKLVQIPEGKFVMGSPENEAGHEDDEQQHEVEITRPLWLGVYPVTQAEYQRVMGSNPSYFSASGGGKEKVRGQDTGRFPVESVTWEEAVDFCRRLTELPEETRQGRAYSLPAEAEWEYSCRGGASSSTPFSFGPTLSSIQANFDGNYPYGRAAKGPNLKRTEAVGCYQANGFGLYDMHGNVWEWCSDWYGADYYSQSPRRDPAGPSEGSIRVVRGGCWFVIGQNCRSAVRSGFVPAYRSRDLGFRVALVLSGR
jgi:formylglycine-generating enzyme required for sulfatase activity